ncbi:MAG TPA: NAD-binding protein [Longimicrobiales bacterium]|nr:NAD-binding protein [Longimicrobiales bacterium]
MKFLSSLVASFVTEREARQNLRVLMKYVLLLFAVVIAFSVAFHFIMELEGRDHTWITGVYWTLVVMSTLGFGDITFVSDLGRAFSVLVLLSGIVLLLVLLPFVFIRFFYAPWLETRVRLRAPRRVPDDVTGHVIICGWDDIAPGLAHRLRTSEVPYYVLEPDHGRAAALLADDISVIAGEPDSGATYHAARVEHARLVFANRGDAANTNIALTVREVSADVPIVAIAESLDAVDILELAGCSRVLPLRHSLGEHLANRLNAGHAHSHVIGRFRGLLIAEFPVHETPLIGRTIRDSQLRAATGVSIIGVWEKGCLRPAVPGMVMHDATVLMVVGTEEQLLELDAFLIIYATNFNPIIVIGGGKVGRAATRALKGKGMAVHVVEKNPDMLPRVGNLPDRVIHGDAADRVVLEEAGIMEAPSVLLTTHDDATNIYLAVYCRRLNPAIRIVSRVTHERNIDAVMRAGADLALSYATLGVESIISFVRNRDVVFLGEGIELFRIEVPTSARTRTIAQIGLGAHSGAVIIGIERGETFHPTPGGEARVEPGDTIFVIADPDEQTELEELLE